MNNILHNSSSLLYIQIKIKIGNKLSNELSKISEKLDTILQNFEHTIDYETIENKEYYEFMPMPEFELIKIWVQNHENNDFFETFFDDLRKEIPFRYMIKCYNPAKKYPSSIRINVRGKKIIIKQQTKILGL